MKTRKYRKLKSRKPKSRKHNKMSKHRRKRYSNRKTRRKSYNGGGLKEDMEQYQQEIIRLTQLPPSEDNKKLLKEKQEKLQVLINLQLSETPEEHGMRV